MTAPKLTLRHTNSGCFDIMCQPDSHDSHNNLNCCGTMSPELVRGSEPVETCYTGRVSYHRRIDQHTTEERTYKATAPTHQQLLEKMQQVVDAYFADAPAAGSTGPGS